MIVAVTTNSGPSPAYIELRGLDEKTARLAACRYVYYGNAHESEFAEQDEQAYEEYTKVCPLRIRLLVPATAIKRLDY